MTTVSDLPDGPVESVIDEMRFTLDITTSMEPRTMNPCILSRFEHEDAVVVDVTAHWYDCDEDEEVARGKIEKLKKLPAFVGSELVLHAAYTTNGVPDPDMARVAELLASVESTQLTH